jgi:hypothetical protein
VNYILNPEKTGLENALDYAMNRDKTETTYFESAFNCRKEHAFEDMTATKIRWNKQSSHHVLGYHIMQSFKPGEITPDQAHKIGVEFVRRYLSGKYEAVVSTHLDRAHLHNHIVFNSVSFTDGRMYRNNFKDYYEGIRGTSDDLCREHGLSVIEPNGSGKQYKEWADEQAGKPTIRRMIQTDIDEIIRQAYTFKTFVDMLPRHGYIVKYGSNVKHMAVKPKGGERYIRLKSLGEDYTEDAIKQRLAQLRDGQEEQESPPVNISPKQKRYQCIGSLPRKKKRKLRGFLALYFRYLYLSGKTKRRKLPNRAAFLLREDVIKFNRYAEQFRFLYAHGIETMDDLAAFQTTAQKQIEIKISERKPLYAERREAPNEEMVSELSAQISGMTATLRKLRREIVLCKRIQNDIPIIQVNIERVQANEAEKEIAKIRSQEPLGKTL